MATIFREGSRARLSEDSVAVIMTWPGGESRTAVRQSVRIGVVGWLFSLSLAVYFIAKPFYLFESGYPQVADFILAGLFVFVLFSKPRIKLDGMPILVLSIYFSIYAFFVNCVWFLIINDQDMWKPALFYIFNSTLIFVILSHNGKFDDSTIRIIMISVILSGLCQIFLSLIGAGQSGYRTYIYFNNPNQLGYWALLSASIILVCARRTQTSFLFQALVLIGFLYVVSLSLSKAAIISFFLLAAIHCLRNPWYILIATIVSVVLIMLVSDWPLFFDVIDRLQTIGQQQDDNLVGRGYDRLWRYPEYMLLGAGEGGFQRFSNISNELHSSFGAVFFSYGVIGTGLFGLILWRLYRVAGLQLFAYLIPAFTYGATHQGLRFSLLWVLFSVIAICGAKRGIDKTKEKGLLGYRIRFSRSVS